MHELLLYGQVPATRHEQVLEILTGIAAMQPRTLLERQFVYRPTRPAEDNKPNKKYPNKPVKPQALIHHQLIEELGQGDFGKERPLSDFQGTEPRSWTLKSQETPEPETKTLVLRLTSEVDVTDDTMQAILNPVQNAFVTESIAEGHRLVHGNVVITLYRLLRLTDQPQNTPSTVLPPLESLLPLDPSGALVLEARVRIDDRTKPTLVSAASEELISFRDLLKGSVEMKVPERLALDTRVK